MNKDKYVFAQLIEFLDNNKFRHLVDKYDGNLYLKHFTCWNQLLAMMFGQLSNRESLRNLIVAFEAHRAKQYHLGLGRKPIAKATFASANQNRDYRIFEDFAFHMMEQARRKRMTDIFKLKGNVYAFDSTTIPLCLSVLWWAKFRKKKGGVKAHQISSAIIAYCLVDIIQHDLQLKLSTYEVLQILSISLMDKTPLVDLFERTDFNNIKNSIVPSFRGYLISI